jgi:(E)-4-hydroxy-3-methylbut-2-enyl-diphosphate synthase
MEHECDVPVIIGRGYYDRPQRRRSSLQCSTDMGAAAHRRPGRWRLHCSREPRRQRGPDCRTAFGILQATRMRISKTEYISCPSCGRTLFDLQETTAKIRSRTSTSKASRSASWAAS